MADFTTPITSGGKKPPRPPAAPTMPVTAPTRSGYQTGHELEHRPHAEAERHAIVRQQIVSGTIDS